MPRGIKATAPAEPTIQAETPVMPELTEPTPALAPEKFTENAAEAEAVALADKVDEPKPKRVKTTRIEVDFGMPTEVAYLLSQRLLSLQGTIVRQVMTMGEYAVTTEDQESVTVGDTSTDARRQSILTTIGNLEEQHAQRRMGRDAAQAQVNNYTNLLEREMTSHERQGDIYPEARKAALEMNIEAAKDHRDKYQAAMDMFQAQIDEAKAVHAAIPERKTWIARLPV